MGERERGREIVCFCITSSGSVFRIRRNIISVVADVCRTLFSLCRSRCRSVGLKYATVDCDHLDTMNFIFRFDSLLSRRGRALAHTRYKFIYFASILTVSKRFDIYFIPFVRTFVCAIYFDYIASIYFASILNFDFFLLKFILFLFSSRFFPCLCFWQILCESE